jgi:hypothetical protein
MKACQRIRRHEHLDPALGGPGAPFVDDDVSVRLGQNHLVAAARAQKTLVIDDALHFYLVIVARVIGLPERTRRFLSAADISEQK